MAYLNDPRENRVGPNGELWESDGRVEKRYYWNGAFVDLCNLPPEEYMKTIFVTSGGGGSEGGGGTIEDPNTNKITIKETKGEGFVSFQAVAQKPVTEPVTVTAKVNTSNGMQDVILTINTGQKLSDVINVNYGQTELKPRTEGMSVNPPTAGEITHKPITPPIETSLYTISGLSGDLSNMTEEEILANSRKTTVGMKTNTESNVFSSNLKEATGAIITDDMTAEDIDQAIIDNMTKIYFLTDREVDNIYAGDKAFSDMMFWREDKTIVEKGSGITYHLWVREDDSGAQTVFPGDQIENWDIIVTYK